MKEDKVKAMSKILALILGDRKRYLALVYHYCFDTPVSDVKYILDKSYQKTKNSLSKSDKVYDIKMLCDLPQEIAEVENVEVFKEVNGRYKCKWCGRYVTKRGRIQHLLKYHYERLESDAVKYLTLISL